MAARLLAVIVLVAGCRQLFGIDDTVIDHDAPVVDAERVDAPGLPDAPPGIDARVCGSDYVPAGAAGHTYRPVANRSRWTQAVTACLSDGAHLVILEDDAENAAVRPISPVDTNQPYIWVGVSDTQTENTWVTVLGAAATYLPWSPIPTPQPNGGTNENCGLLGLTGSLSDGRLFDYDCNASVFFVCECE